MPATLEKVTFRTNPGVSEAEFLNAAEATSAWVRAQPGFGYRTLIQDADGLWIDLVFWASEADAQAASKAIMSAPQAASFMALIDAETVTMAHFEQRHVAMSDTMQPA